MIFHGPVILSNISKTSLWICIILGIKVWGDSMNDLILDEGQCDLYFMSSGLTSDFQHYFMDLHYTCTQINCHTNYRPV